MNYKKDYYEILGVHRKSTSQEIKKAYRKLAMQFHPDKSEKTDRASAEEQFKAINEAYSVLSDIQKRRMYDVGGHQMLNGMTSNVHYSTNFTSFSPKSKKSNNSYTRL